MREIKFRVWNGQEMLYVTYEAELQLNFGINKGWSLWDSYEDICNHEKGNLLQFTGLKDKNGREIYEGDIINIIGRETSEQAQVTFDDGSFCVMGYLGDLRTQPLRKFIFFGEKFEVIGNIYENSKLLET
ncbi:YopX family protein [Cytobacillus oceanisediminis]|uniref:YopX family protein n=1 Tax=Cytobacillus oceanisediminis TaxID=665099 RepID=UPI002079C4F2|nr:YopX family protein [Cytobacillus oceanisediminis]USK46255.1 YopX family protein [Cytobacillus oceanisediminis]